MAVKIERIESIDFFRGLAVLLVIFYHYKNMIPYGYLGVDLFFIISGYLVGGVLIQRALEDRLEFWKFILQRGFKYGHPIFSF